MRIRNLALAAWRGVKHVFRGNLNKHFQVQIIANFLIQTTTFRCMYESHRGIRARTTRRVWSSMSVGCEPWTIDKISQTRTRAHVNVRPQSPLCFRTGRERGERGEREYKEKKQGTTGRSERKENQNETRSPPSLVFFQWAAHMKVTEGLE